MICGQTLWTILPSLCEALNKLGKKITVSAGRSWSRVAFPLELLTFISEHFYICKTKIASPPFPAPADLSPVPFFPYRMKSDPSSHGMRESRPSSSCPGQLWSRGCSSQKEIPSQRKTWRHAGCRLEWTLPFPLGRKSFFLGTELCSPSVSG